MEKLLTVEQLSALIQVSRRTLYEWTHTGFIPYYKFPKGIRFKESNVEKWLEKRKKEGRSSYKLKIQSPL